MASDHSARSVREDFHRFFEERGHSRVPSAPVFPQDDPTLLFTNAGMNQFKDVFLGAGSRAYSRAVDSQKCIRVQGKHNDLEEVGVDTYHHTFFEMLGNWSFGDYFKEEAIPWAWELLTGVWGLPKERLWVTVFGGDEKDGLQVDSDAERIWRETTDIDHDRILRFDRTDNFWEMGETGPCGPCSEIHIDRGDASSDPRDGADPKIGVNAGNERFIELWNLVFMEFNRLQDGSLKRLPKQHVDTGMGFERILSVLQGKLSNYDTDLFGPIFARLSELSGRPYGEDRETDIAFRVAADHVRAVSSALADGALPSNTGRGYVLRRLIRRAARYGRQTLGLEDPFLFELCTPVADVLGDAFPEIVERQDHIRLLVETEERSFARTLGRGLVQFQGLADRVAKEGTAKLPGAEAYELYATYGFPRDLVDLMARERSLAVDDEGWDAAESSHREKSKSEGRFKQLVAAEDLEGLSATTSTFHEQGDRAVALSTRARMLDADEDGDSVRAHVVLDESPFYPEGGGQIGDSGTIEAGDGSFLFRVEDTQRVGEVVVHVGTLERGLPFVGEERAVEARVDADRRARTMRNHTGTHLLHKALREVLGDHVVQQGSYVGPDRLRFDFAHPQGMTPDEIDEVERRVNRHVFANASVGTTLEDLEEAKARGVMALFGEKYEERVRVVAVGDWSMELCGGTHVGAAGDIGPLVILSEGAIQAGVRRIEAVTGDDAVAAMQAQRKVLRDASRALKTSPEELAGRVEQLQEKLKEAKKKSKAAAASDVGSALDKVRGALADRDGFRSAIVDLPELDQAALRELGNRAKTLGDDLAVAIFGRADGRVPFLVLCQGAALEKGHAAGELAKAVSGVLGGGGGGKPAQAQGQGAKPDAVPEAVALLEERLSTGT